MRTKHGVIIVAGKAAAMHQSRQRWTWPTTKVHSASANLDKPCHGLDKTLEEVHISRLINGILVGEIESSLFLGVHCHFGVGKHKVTNRTMGHRPPMHRAQGVCRSSVPTEWAVGWRTDARLYWTLASFSIKQLCHHTM
jgi:hypothetical protein